ncbi:MAG: hypothetical protein ACPG6B_06415 [Oceanihabitans sp.]
MKNSYKFVALLLLVSFCFACSPESLTEDTQSTGVDVVATGGDDSSEIDTDRD